MSTFLQALYKQAIVEGKDDLSIVPEDAIKDIKKNIRDGAADLEQDWANAMELTHKAYSVAGVERPTPSERSAWTQYEEMLQLAVNELADARKLSKNDRWRMSSKEFKESMEPRIKVRIVELGDSKGKGWTTEAKNLEEIIEMVRKQAGERGYDMDVSDADDGKKVCTFSEYGIKRNYRVTLQRL
jgi:hypothetical protein